MKFGFRDYFRMWKKRGFRLPLTYFFQTHLFDLIHHTDTHIWLPKDKYIDTPTNLDNGVLYMRSWTNTIKIATNKAIEFFDLRSKSIVLVDIGCGKGKVLCVWNKMLPKATIIGIDYSSHLLNICKENLSKISASNVELICADAANFKLDNNFEVYLYYLYNPFDTKILDQFLKNIIHSRAVIIYNNPVHKATLLDNGFYGVYHKKSWHQNGDFSIFSNLKLN